MKTALHSLHSTRLKLFPLTLGQLQASLHSTPELAKDLKILVVSTLIDGNARRAVNMKIEKMEKMPASEHPWQTYWLILLKEENTGIGLVGFKGKPDAQGEVEIGYGIDPFYQGKGYMTEAVSTLVKWAFAHPECKAVTAHGVRADNYASQKVLVRNGFIEVGENKAGFDYILHR